MLTNELVLTIPGNPATKGSLKCIGRVGKRAHVLIEDHKSSKPWREKVSGWTHRAYPAGQRATAGQPVGAELSFTIDRPASHYGTGRNARVLKDRFVHAHPVGQNTGDVDKLLRLVLDALQDAEVLPDDAQVIETTSRKAYVDAPGRPDVLPWPGVVIRLYPID